MNDRRLGLRPLLYKGFRYFVGTALVAAAVACRPGDQMNQDGGQHGGGGHVQKSSPAQVHQALDTALALIRDPKRNLLRDYATHEKLSGGADSKTHFLKAQGEDSTGDLMAQVLAAFARPLDIRQTGDCGRPQDNHADAAVSAFDPSATICISIGNLTRISPVSLLQNVTALLVHEAVHLCGGDEAEAIYFQDRFALYFGARFGDQSRETLQPKIEAALKECDLQIMRTKHFAFHKVGSQITAGLADLEDKLILIPGLTDAVALNLALKPAHPEKVDNYLNAIYALLAVVRLDLHHDQTPAQIQAEETAGIDWVARFDALDKLMATVQSNWKAYALGQGVSECPQVPVQKMRLILISDGESLNRAASDECDL